MVVGHFVMVMFEMRKLVRLVRLLLINTRTDVNRGGGTQRGLSWIFNFQP